jgi:formate dehydrogenase accessory protein FdhD
MAKTVNIPVTIFGPDGKQPGQDEIACEMPLTIFFNGTELLTTLCTPVDLDYLTAGILESEGLIACPADIRSMKMSTDGRTVYFESP